MGLTQGEVARKIGISVSYYTQIERGTRNPSGRTAFLIASFFGIEMAYFFDGSDA